MSEFDSPLRDRAHELVLAASPDAKAIAGELSKSRALTQAWWHADDAEQAIECLTQDLASHGLSLEAELRSVIEARHEQALEEDEDEARRHQLGLAAVIANAAFARAGGSRRFRCFLVHGPLEWESDEPPWVLVEEGELPILEKLFGGLAKGSVEESYEGVDSLDDIQES